MEQAEAIEAIERRRVQREIELQEAKLRAAEAQRLGARGNDDETDDQARHIRYKAERPKMPAFNEDRDDIDAYLLRYEQVAEANRWPGADWALHLSTLLTGKALELYARLTPEGARNYQELKIALLRRYDCTAEGFRKKFFDSRREPNETATIYLGRSQRYFTRWIEMSRVNKTYEELLELMVKEQFLATCEPHMSVYIKERSLNRVAEVAKAADIYLDARRYAPDLDKGKVPRSNPVAIPPAAARVNEVVRRSSQEGQRLCFNCNKPGHVARDCRSRGVRRNPNVPLRRANNNACIVEDDATPIKEVGDTAVTLALAGGGVNQTPTNLFIRAGTMGGRAINVMRDTGCTSAVVRSGLVSPHQMTGRSQTYRMIDGTVRTAPVARVHIKSPYFTGSLDAICVARPLCDVIVGNIDGADSEKVSVGTQTDSPMEVNAVVTRSQAVAEDASPRKLKVFEQVDASVTRDELIEGQRADETLARAFKQAKQGLAVQYDKGGKSRYEVLGGLLRRVYTNEGGREAKQLVVPKKLRTKVLSLAHDAVLTGHLGIKKTTDRILADFFWPGLTADVTRYCR